MSKALAEKYKEIEAVKNRFLEKSARLTTEQLNKRPSDGGWSAGQVLYHCAFAESGTILVIHKNLAENKVRLKRDLGSVFRNLLLVMFLKSPLKFKAPKVVSKVPDSISMEEIRQFYDKNSSDYHTILNELPAELEDKYIFKHPMSGLFTIEQTLSFTKEHYLHHERQLDALLGK